MSGMDASDRRGLLWRMVHALMPGRSLWGAAAKAMCLSLAQSWDPKADPSCTHLTLTRQECMTLLIKHGVVTTSQGSLSNSSPSFLRNIMEYCVPPVLSLVPGLLADPESLVKIDMQQLVAESLPHWHAIADLGPPQPQTHMSQPGKRQRELMQAVRAAQSAVVNKSRPDKRQKEVVLPAPNA